jgi:sorbitol-specific phosphotransferase system component IIA
VALLASPVSALAELALTVDGISNYQYNTNVFDLQPGFPTPFGTTGNYGDSYITYGGKLDASYLLSQQQFYATVVGTEYRYDRFKELDHSEFNFDGGWDWRIGRLWDGILDVAHIRSMVSFWNVVGTSLVIQTEQRETGRASLQFTPDWRTEFTGITRKVDQPQPTASAVTLTGTAVPAATGYTDLTLTETSGEAAIKYTGTAGVTSGLAATYLKGSFSNTGPVLAPSYTQTSGALTATDVVTGLSTFRGAIGYSRRSSDSGINNIGGVTGELDYQRALTGKTSFEADLTRQINAYLTNDASEIDSVAALTATWQATYKIGVVLGYTFTYRQLPHQGTVLVDGVTVSNGAQQTEYLNLPSLAVTYTPVPWLILKPYVNYQTRTSQNFAGGNFDATVVGLQFTLQFQRGVIPPRTSLY